MFNWFYLPALYAFLEAIFFININNMKYAVISFIFTIIFLVSGVIASYIKLQKS